MAYKRKKRLRKARLAKVTQQRAKAKKYAAERMVKELARRRAENIATREESDRVEKTKGQRDKIRTVLKTAAKAGKIPPERINVATHKPQIPEAIRKAQRDKALSGDPQMAKNIEKYENLLNEKKRRENVLKFAEAKQNSKNERTAANAKKTIQVTRQRLNKINTELNNLQSLLSN
jgi:hypothetical protein